MLLRISFSSALRSVFVASSLASISCWSLWVVVFRQEFVGVIQCSFSFCLQILKLALFSSSSRSVVSSLSSISLKFPCYLYLWLISFWMSLFRVAMVVVCSSSCFFMSLNSFFCIFMLSFSFSAFESLCSNLSKALLFLSEESFTAVTSVFSIISFSVSSWILSQCFYNLNK